MAKIKFGMMMTDARGKLGGQVFSKNRSCAYVRTKVSPVNPQTTFQSSVRALFGSISQQWSGLSQATRDAWDGAVNDWQTTNVFGDLVNPTGKALFQRLNNQAQAVGLAAVTNPPAKLVMPDDIITNADFDVTIPEIVLTGANTEATTRIALWATAPLSQGTKFVKNRLRLIYAAAGNAYSDSAAGDAYLAKFGTPLAGANVYVGVKYVLANGQASPLQVLKVVVTD